MTAHRLAPTAAIIAALVLAGCSGATEEPPVSSPESSPTAPSAGDPAQPTLSYVSLGDSYTAAPGIPETDPTGGCLRSSRNYPALVAEQLEEEFDVALEDRSCSGAQTTDLTGSQPVGTRPVPPQLDALDRDTDLVTLSIGANDFGAFARLVGGCVALSQQDPDGSPCRDAARREGDVLEELQVQVQQRLVDVVREIRSRSPRAEVLLVGYPQLVPAGAGCPDLLPIADGDLGFARRINKALTDNLARAAGRTGTTYVDVWSASAGHDICAGDPWVSGRGGEPGGAAPFHPLPAGQQAVADLVVDEVDHPARS